MAENVYDDPAFQAEYQRLARSELGLDGAPEWAAVAALLSDLRGRDVVDLGCGYGAFARWAIDQGAARVDAFDLSERMLDRARSLTDEFVTTGSTWSSSNFPRRRTISPTARWCCTTCATLTRSSLVSTLRCARVGHSCSRRSTPSSPRQLTRRSSTRTGSECGQLDRYGEEAERIRDWLTAGVRKQHRTTGTLMNALVDAGFTVRRVLDWIPTAEQVKADPGLAEEITRPMFSIVAADR